MSDLEPQSTRVDPDAPVARTVAGLAWPAIMVSLLQTMVYLADSIMLGQFDRDGLASMQVQGPVLWSVFSVFTGLTVGTVALVSRRTGAGDQARARAVARVSMRLSLGLGLAVGVLGVAMSGIVAHAMSPDEAVASLATGYMRVAFVSFPGVFVAVTAAMILNGSGDTRTPFRVGILTNVINVAVNYVCIFGARLGPLELPSLGVTGAAVGTAAAYVTEGVLLSWLLRRAEHPASIRGWFLGWGRERAVGWELCRLGAPALLERVVIHAGFLAFARVVNSLGPLTMAANQALLGLEAVCFMGAEGFGVAAATVVGQLLGHGRPERAARAAWTSVGLGVAVLGACGLTIWISAPWTLWIFAEEGRSARELVDAALRAVPLLALAQPFMATSVILGHALRGAGDMRSPLIAALVGGLCLRVCGAWVLGIWLQLGVVGIWLATTVDWSVRTTILIAVFVAGRWRAVQI